MDGIYIKLFDTVNTRLYNNSINQEIHACQKKFTDQRKRLNLKD